jgi:hypothetical protein
MPQPKHLKAMGLGRLGAPKFGFNITQGRQVAQKSYGGLQSKGSRSIPLLSAHCQACRSMQSDFEGDEYITG